MADIPAHWRRRTSYAHGAPDLPQRKTAIHDHSAKQAFEANRCPWRAKQMNDDGLSEAERRERAARRESFMVKRSKPKPELKPSRALAYGPDRAAFDQAWRDEYRDAQTYTRKRWQDR